MLRRVVSVLRRQPALGRDAFGRTALALAAALGLALACLNPQNDDLPSNDERGEVAGDFAPEGQPPPANNADNGAPPGASPAPESPADPALAPPAGEEPPSDGGDQGVDLNDLPPDAGSPDAGAPSEPPPMP